MFYTSLVSLFATFALLDTALQKEKAKKILLSFLCFSVLFLTAGLRWKTGNDWSAYFNFYQFASDMSYQAFSFEWGFRALVQVCKMLGISYTGFLLIVSILQLVGFFRLFSLFSFPAVICFVFLTTYFFGYIGTLRQTIAISFCLLGFVSLTKHKTSVFYFWVIMGTLFHFSAIIFIIARFVPKNLVSPWIYFLLGIGAIIIGTVIIPVLLSFLPNVSESFSILQKVIDYSTTKSGLGEQENLSVTWYVKRLAFVGVFYVLAISNKDQLIERCFNLYFCSFLIFIVFFNFIPMIALRGGEYFSIFEVVLLSTLFVGYRDINLRLALLLVLIVLSSMRMYSSLNAYHPELYFPYYSVFEKYEASRFMH